jgi:peptidoglycan hydrolase-like protein with peptidoglycan-binding domain
MKKVIRLTESDLEKIVKRVLKEQSDNKVKLVQQALISKGYKIEPNGVFDSETKLAVIDFQKNNGIKQTGNVGPTTAKVLKVQPLTSPINNKEQREKDIAKKIVGTTEVSNPNAYLQFNGKQLQWVAGGEVIKTWKAISGLTLFNTPISDWNLVIRRWLISPEKFSKDKDAGPTPPGKYTVGPLQTREGDTESIGSISALWKILTGDLMNTPAEGQYFTSNSDYSKIGWGNYRASIIPQSGTETYGRKNFYIHGGTLPGSHGCIDLTDEMDDFAKFYGTWLSITHKKSIPLIVNYELENQNVLINKLWKSMWSGNPKGPSNYEKYKQNNRWYTDPGKI